MLIPLTASFIALDFARHFNRAVETWFVDTFGILLRRREISRKRLNGATYVLIAATLSVIIFPKIIAVTGFIILIISDMASALVGRRFGKHRFLAKSLEGSAAFFITAIVVVLLTPKIDYLPGEYIIGGMAAAVGAVVEALPIDIDDNLTIPVGVGITMWIGYAILLPGLNLHKFG